MSQYMPKSIQLLKGSDNFPLPIHLQIKYQIDYNCTLYGAWSSSMHVLNVGTKFVFSGNSYMIAKYKIDVTNLGLFILSRVFVPFKQLVALIPFCGHFYSRPDYLNIVKYKHSISMYSVCMNNCAYGNFNKKNLLYINGRQKTHGNIAGFINHFRSSLFTANCSFEKHSNDKEFFMKRKAFRFVVVHAICSLYLGDKLLINSNFCRPPMSPWGVRKRSLSNYIFLCSMELI